MLTFDEGEVQLGGTFPTPMKQRSGILRALHRQCSATPSPKHRQHSGTVSEMQPQQHPAPLLGLTGDSKYVIKERCEKRWAERQAEIERQRLPGIDAHTFLNHCWDKIDLHVPNAGSSRLNQALQRQ